MTMVNRPIRFAHVAATSSIVFCLAVFADVRAEQQAKLDERSLEFFELRVRPLLIQRCYECHGPDAEQPKGGLRMSSRTAFLKGGDTGAAIVPGDPQKSLLIDAINYGEVYQMPPKSKLPDHEIATLTKWVERDAPWPDDDAHQAPDPKRTFNLKQRRDEHWCWQGVKTVFPRSVQNNNWPKNPLDHFILAKLETKELQPTEPADCYTLIRRAYFDLIGLPPSLEEIDAFVHDESPQAFEKVVDSLLSSQHFGERWARHWMDMVRYAETYGHEFDYPLPHAWRYRDYLIRALNADVPYDQFVIEHIAGDLLNSPRRHPTENYNESIIGTGFWWLGEATHAPVDVLGDEARRVDNQIDVMSKTFLGLTIACARCHDHKFDAISTKDYYALSGYVKSSRRQEAILDPGAEIRKVTEKLQALKTTGDQLLRLALPTPSEHLKQSVTSYLRAAREVMFGEPTSEEDDQNVLTDRGEANDHGRVVQKVASQFDVDPDRLSRWVAGLNSEATQQPTHPLNPWLALARHRGALQAQHVVQQRHRLSEEAKKAVMRDEQTVLIAGFNGPNFADWFVTGYAFGHGPTQAGQWDSRQRGVTAARAGVVHSGMLADRHQGVLRSPTFTITHPNIYYHIAGQNAQVRLIVDSYFMNVHSDLLFAGFQFKVDTDGKWIWHRQAADVSRYVGHRAHIEIIDHGDGWLAVDEIRFADGDLPGTGDNPLARKVFDNPKLSSLDEITIASAGLITESLTRWHNATADVREADLVRWAIRHKLLDVDQNFRDQLDEVGRQLAADATTIPAAKRVLAMADGTGQNRRIHVRGNHRAPGPEAPRQMLVAIAGDSQRPVQHGSGRLEFARKLVDPSNPLTSRVMLNRIWHHLFGRGIVASVDNFGVLGQRPSHPELLDYLAGQFVHEGWSLKRMLRQIMLSSTYQMSSLPSEKGSQVDPQNLLLHRMRIRRLQGESIRDAILAISGRLDRKMYGNSVPQHITSFMQGRGRPETSGPLDGDGRRSLYTEVRRNFLPPMMLAFDTPQPFSSVGHRNVSNVPAQALILMNDPFVVDQARIWAQQLLADTSPSTEQRLHDMYVAGIGRPPSDTELAEALEFLDQQSHELRLSNDGGRLDERVWADLCHVLMNVKAFIFIN